MIRDIIDRSSGAGTALTGAEGEMFTRQELSKIPGLQVINNLQWDGFDVDHIAISRTTDVNGYDENGIGLVLSVARDIRASFRHPARDVLVTKVMLGVFGCVPAFDTYFPGWIQCSNPRPQVPGSHRGVLWRLARGN